MPSGFLGIFSRRDQAKSARKQYPNSDERWLSAPASAKSTSGASVADSSELHGSELSAETEYVLADANSPALPNASNASASPSSKLKVPFRRRMQYSPDAMSSSSKVDLHDYSPPPPLPAKPSYAGSYSDHVSLRPPPSRSAIFSTNSDLHGGISTHSLPNAHHQRKNSNDANINHETMSNPDFRSAPNTSASPKSKNSAPRSGGLFSWARSRSRPPETPQSAPPLPVSKDESFNLKSFRHVTPRPESPLPERPPSSLSTYLPPARPRPREGSTASDSSQRISVAAFREAQARRSAANSPVPSFKPDMARPETPRLSSAPPGRPRSSTLGKPDPIPIARGQPVRKSSFPLFPSSGGSSSSESEESEESESDEEPTLRPSRKSTITRHSSKSQSELGHRVKPRSPFASSSGPVSAPISNTSSQGSSESRGRSALPSQGARSVSAFASRTRASQSTSALVPDTAAKRASQIVQAPVSVPKVTTSSSAPLPPRPSSSSSESSSSDSSDDDAPLASFMLPLRPGSAASGNSRMPAKPLVDISDLKMPIPRRTIDNAELASETSRAGKVPPPTKTKTVDDILPQRARKTSLGVSDRLAQLAAAANSRSSSPAPAQPPPKDPSPSITTQPRTQSPGPMQPRSKSPGPSQLPPTRPKHSSRPNLKITSSSSSNSHPPSSSFSSVSSDASTPIVPTPIRERERQPGFAVTSRPLSHHSSGSVGTITAFERTDPPKDAMEASQPTIRMVRGSSANEASDESPLPRPDPKPASTNPRVPTTTLVSKIPANNFNAPAPPRKPFTSVARDNSPASSTGGSSSSRMPPTPRDGSEVGAPSSAQKREFSSPRDKEHRKRASVTFAEDLVGGTGMERDVKPVRNGVEDAAEQKRRERRRGEAKAAIEFGKVVNGKGPIVDDDDDEDLRPPHLNMGMLNTPSMVGGNVPFPGQWGTPVSATSQPFGNMSGGMNMPMGMGMNMGMNMNMNMADPMMLAAHRQAMLIAKQTYLQAVAQQAMQVAGDEWERGSTVSGWGGGGGGGMPAPVPGMNMGMFPGNFGMGMGSGGSVINGGMGGGWSGGSMIFPSGPRSTYAGSMYAGSEVAGPSAGWGSRSAYGDASAPPRDRSSRAVRQSIVPPVPSLPASASAPAGTKREGPRTRTMTAPSSGGPAAKQAAGVGKKGPLVGVVAPPSSWRGPS